MTDLKISAMIVTTPSAHGHAVAAEALGYDRVWFTDVPQHGEDVWYQLRRAAEETSRIGLGPGVLVPSLRHPTINAGQTLLLSEAAPGRVAVAFGTGFTSRAAFGQPALTWSYMKDYITTYQQLVSGQTAVWDGAPIELFLPGDYPTQTPHPVPLLVAANGPKGIRVAHEVGADGIFGLAAPTPGAAAFNQTVVVVTGTVLNPDEGLDDERVRGSGGPAWALNYHFTYEKQGDDAVREMPGGAAWIDETERTPKAHRHLEIHRNHALGMSNADNAAWNAGGSLSLTATTLSGTPELVAAKVRNFAEQGATELVYHVSGTDVHRELATFADAVGI
jgi:5,10-methylenetetrahydromethanopterin reductase